MLRNWRPTCAAFSSRAVPEAPPQSSSDLEKALVEYLPTVNATLNFISFCLLLVGWRRIKAGDREGHKRAMLSAVTTSALFLACYVTYHYAHGHTVYQETGTIRIVYFTILATHVPLAILMVLPIIFLLRAGLRDEIARHRRLARWVLPIWLYVSITGVAIYVILYRL